MRGGVWLNAPPRGPQEVPFVAGPFDPQDLSPALYLKSSSLASLSDGDPVGTWPDFSGNGRDLTQATAGAKPAYKTAIINGLATVRFDGVDDYLEYLGGADWVTGTGLTVFAVHKRITTLANAGTAAFKSNVGTADYNNAESCVVGFQAGGSNVQGYRNGALSNATHPGNGVAFIECSQWDGVNHTTYKNNVGATAVASTGTFAIRQCHVGRRNPSVEFHNADYGEVIVYARSLTSTERGDVTTFLSDKWGVAI